MALDPAILDAFKNQLANFQSSLKTTYAQYVKNKADFDTSLFKANALFSGFKAQFDSLRNLLYTTYQGTSSVNTNSDGNKIIGLLVQNYQYMVQSFPNINQEGYNRSYFLNSILQQFTTYIGYDYAKFSTWVKTNYPSISDTSPAWDIAKQFLDTQGPIYDVIVKTLLDVKAYLAQYEASKRALDDLKSAIDGYLSQFAGYKADIANFPSYDDLLSAAKDDHPLAILAPPVVTVPVEQAPPPQPPQQIVQESLPVKKGIDPKLIAAGVAALFLFARKR